MGAYEEFLKALRRFSDAKEGIIVYDLELLDDTLGIMTKTVVNLCDRYSPVNLETLGACHEDCTRWIHKVEIIANNLHEFEGYLRKIA